MSRARQTPAVSKRQPQFAIGALSVELVSSGAAPDEFRLFPAGEFRSHDGRPTECAAWLMTDEDGLRLVAEATARQSDYVIDYEHQTLRAEKNGQPAPASAWFKNLEWRTGDGLYVIDPSWTALAAQRVIDKEYRYVSPVFSYDKTTGRVGKLLHAALTNNPGLDGLTDLAALAALVSIPQPQESAMDELLDQLRWLLNLPVGATADDTIAQLQKLIDQLKAGPAQAATSFDLIAHLAKVEGSVAALTGATAPDPAQFVAVATLTAVQTELATSQTELAALKAEKLDVEVNRVVTEALSAGKLTPATEPWARELGKTNLAALTSYVAAAQAVVTPGVTQTGGAAPAGTETAALSAEVQAVCAQLGVDPKDYAKTAGQA